MRIILLSVLIFQQVSAITLDTNYFKGNHPILDSLSRIKDVKVSLKIEKWNSEGYVLKALNDSSAKIYLTEKKVIEIKNSLPLFSDILSNGCFAYNKYKYPLTKGCMCNSLKVISYYFNKRNDSLIIYIDPEDTTNENAEFWYNGKYCFFILKDEYLIKIRKAFNELEKMVHEGCCK